MADKANDVSRGEGQCQWLKQDTLAGGKACMVEFEQWRGTVALMCRHDL